MSRSASIRRVLTATAISAVLLAATVAQALASGNPGPFPK